MEVLLSAAVPGAGNDTTVTYVANLANDETQAEAPWRTVEGVYTLGADGVFSPDGVFSDFSSALTLTSFVPAIEGQSNAILIYGLVNAVAQSKQTAAFTYETTNMMEEAIALTIRSVDIDPDGNGFPDDPFTFVAPGETSVANVLVNGAGRTALLANLDEPVVTKQTDSGVVVAFGNVMVTSPTKADLVNAGLIDSGDSAISSSAFPTSLWVRRT